eukprot:59879_1
MPSYGYWYEQKATTLWENWQSSQYQAHGSKNHIMFGAQSGWYYQYLAGIKQTDKSRNWDTIIIDPYTNATLFNITSISATVNTYKGAVSSSWSVDIGKGGTCDANVGENSQAPLKCTGGGTINKIIFASYGTPSGLCGNFKINPSCNNNNSMGIVTGLCLGKTSCSVPVNNNEFKYDPCVNVVKHLDVQVECTKSGMGYVEIEATIPTGSTGLIFLRRTLNMVNNGNPDISKWIVTENGNTVWQNMKFSNNDQGVVDGKVVDDSIMFTVLSGSYTFILSAST